jgi:glucose/arabinose dehydrogenase
MAGGGDLEAFYRQLGAAVFNIYYGVDDIDYIEPATAFRDIIQTAVDGDVGAAKNALETANNLGCPLADDGRQIKPAEDIAHINSGSAPSTDNINLPDGYSIEPVLWNLTAPDSVTFDGEGNMYVAEAGYPFTGLPEVPRILKVSSDGDVSVLADIGFNAPIVDIAFHDGKLFVSHRHKVSTVDVASGAVKDIIVGLPTGGDHHVNQIAFSADGERLYFGTGSATNSGVASGDDLGNAQWIVNSPQTRDVPAKNVTLAGHNFNSPDILTAEPGDNATTGAFSPFGHSTTARQEAKGELKCSSCILSANLDGTGLQLEAWGMRNPSGLAFNDDGRLFAAVHGADERSSRPIANDTDKFYEVRLDESAWYGWPDFAGDAEPVTDDKFQSSKSSEPLEFLMEDHPAVEKPLALFQPAHSGVIQMDFAPEEFGHAGEAFVAQIGPNVPVPPELGIVGQNVVRVNVTSGAVSDFLTLNEPTTAFSPTDVKFHADDGDVALYLVDWGNILPPTVQHTGVVWKITHAPD